MKHIVSRIYPAFTGGGYPGVTKASPAYEMKPEGLNSRLAEHNNIDRPAPFFVIHGDRGKLVAPAQGHNLWQGSFQCVELLRFVVTHAKP